ncbi:MAG: helix-turn-helix domain-containing protein [Planctomycetales bacterium]|nr:helix-turn-helix domain-containing protein [Planctomycetales bacterium]
MRKNRELTPNTRLVSYQLLAEMLSCSVSQVFALQSSGRIPLKKIRLGGSVRFDRRQVEAWIEQGCPVQRFQQKQ